MGAEGMGDPGEREAAGSAVGSQPAPVVQPWIGKVQASALWRSAPDRDPHAAGSGLPASVPVAAGFAALVGPSRLPVNTAELVARLERSGQALGKAAAGHPATHHLMGAGVEGIDGQQQAGQARGAHA